MLIDAHRCLKCGYEWVTTANDEELPNKPKKCPKCKSAKWDRIHKIVAE